MRGIVLGTLLALVAVAPAGAQVQSTHPWPAPDVDSRAKAEVRGLDQARNPAYQLGLQQGRGNEGGIDVDPFRFDWHQTRGVRQRVTFENRYGATLAGHLYRPRGVAGPLPTVVVLPGLSDPAYEGDVHRNYEPMVQQLAENGYVVFAVDPQMQGLSENDPDPRFCGSSGWWREPQEAGLVEKGACAGYDAPGELWYADPAMGDAIAPLEGTPAWIFADSVLFLASQRLDTEGFKQALADAYETFRARFTFTGIDAAKWLVSAANPWRDRVDVSRMGIAGHSAGADGAVIAGTASELFKAVVAWDGYGTPPTAMPARVPTMLQQSDEANLMSPWGGEAPDPEFWPSYDLAGRFAAAGVPHAVVALRGSTHSEWSYVPNAATVPFGNASAKGQQVATYFTVAWFDRFLKGASASRLTAANFDRTADRTSIGSGRFDPVTGRNVPYAIAGDRTSEHLSRLFKTVVVP